MRRWIDRLQSAALLVLGAVSFVYFGPFIDKMFPVIDPFVVANKEVSGDTVTISGWLHKRRECEFLEAAGRVERDTGLPLSIPFEFVDTEKPYTRPMGAQEWGPWKMVVPVTTVANSAKRLSTERSSVAISLANKAKIPNGASFITQPIINIIMSKNC